MQQKNGLKKNVRKRKMKNNNIFSFYAPFYGARYGDNFKSSASAPRNGALL